MKKKWLILFIIMVAILLAKNYINWDNLSNIVPTITTSEYKTIKKDVNSNYTGIGQKKVENKDGYFTTFTTEEKNQKTYKEYKQNGTASWSSQKYWDGVMADTGCGITAMATILSGYHHDTTPEDLRQKYFPVLKGDKIPKELSNLGIQNSGFYYDTTHLSNLSIQNHLQTNRPILICVWNKPTANRWTTASHYMVLLASDNKGNVYVSNPNGLEHNSKSSGWYDIDEVTPYIAKILYIESY